jgi:hypothetical protein
MKATVEIADALFAEAKEMAKERNISLRELVECGLRKELSERRRSEERRGLRDELVFTPHEPGLRPPFTWSDWAAIKEAARERGEPGDRG